MPRDRLRSPRAGHGRKTTSLTDFEYRVWDQYQLSADDFGVMRLWPNKLKADNDALAKRTDEEVQAALQRLVAVGLALEFEHQDARYMCDPTWQEFQKIESPYVTFLPKPPVDVLKKCNEPTRRLFRKWPGGRSKGDHKTITKRSPNDHQTRAFALANGYRHEADGTRRKAEAGDPDLQAEFERFWAVYPRKVAKPRALKAFLKLGPAPSLMTAILAAVERQAQTEQWQADDGQYIPHPATWLNSERWADETPAAGRASVRAAKPSVDERVAKLCAAAGIAKHDVGKWFIGATLTVDAETGERRLWIPDPDIRAFVRRNFGAALMAALASQHGTLVILDRVEAA